MALWLKVKAMKAIPVIIGAAFICPSLLFGQAPPVVLEVERQNAQEEADAERGDDGEPGDQSDDESQSDATKEARDEATKTLEAFFEEMKVVVDEPANSSKVMKELRAELKREYRELERRILDDSLFGPEQVTELMDRQRIIAQCYQDLQHRIHVEIPHRLSNMHQVIHQYFNNFKNRNPKLASDPRLAAKENEFSAFFGHGVFGYEIKSLAETTQELSGNDVPPEKVVATSLAHPQAQQGPIQELHHGLRSLLKFKWHEGNLVLDRDHWDVLFARMTVADVRREVDRQLERKGIIVSNTNGGYSPPNDSNGARLFKELTAKRVNNQRFRAHARSSFRDEKVMALLYGVDRFDLRIEELQGPRRWMRITEPERGLEFLLVGREFVHRFSPKPNGGLTVVEITNDEVLRFDAESFADLYRREPKFVEGRFFALLDHLGIIAPPGRFHPQVVARLFEIISRRP